MGRNTKTDQKDSISLQDSIRITMIANEEPSSKYFLVQFLMMWVGIYTPMYCFISSFDLAYEPDTFLLSTLITALIYWLIFFYHKYLYLTLPIAFLFDILLIFRYKKYLENGFYYLENAIIDKINVYFDLSIISYRTALSEKKCITILLIAMLQVVCIVLAIQVMREIRKDIYVFISLILVLSGFLVGKVPNSYALLAYVAYLFMIFSMGNGPLKKRLKKKNNLKNKDGETHVYKQLLRLKVSSIVGIILCFLSIVIMLLFTNKDYNNYIDFSRTKQKLQSSLMEFSIEDATEQIRTRFNKINPFLKRDGLFSSPSHLSGGLSGGGIAVTGRVEFTNRTALKLTIPKESSSVYLKGFAGATYTKDAWKGLSDKEAKEYKRIVETYGSGFLTGESLASFYLDMLFNGVADISKTPYFQQIMAHKLKRFTIDVDYVDVNAKFMYAPYFLNRDSLPVKAMDDLYLKPEKKKSAYTFQYYNLQEGNDVIDNLIRLHRMNQGLIINKIEEYETFVSFEKEYRKFVYNTYIGIPEGMFPQIEAANLGITKAYDTESMIQTIEEVCNYLSSNTTYTLSPGDLPEGRDFIEYFLFTNKKGYCLHYASSAVMLLRYYGVPARYVEGYIVTEADISNGKVGEKTSYSAYSVLSKETKEWTNNITVEIRDTNAHSWVEVYLDGVGWVPVEMTAGYSREGIDSVNESIMNRVTDIPTTTPMPTNTPKPTDIAAPTNTTAPGEPTNTPIPTELNITNTPKPPSGHQTEDNASVTDDEGKAWGYILLRILIIIVVFIIIRYMLLRYIRDKHIYNVADKNAAAIAIYKEIERILLALGFLKIEEETYKQFFERVSREYGPIVNGYQSMLEHVLKARFSNEMLKRDELKDVMSFYLAIRKSLYEQCKPLRKYYMKYWKVI